MRRRVWYWNPDTGREDEGTEIERNGSLVYIEKPNGERELWSATVAVGVSMHPASLTACGAI